jgi:hypothetical protein
MRCTDFHIIPIEIDRHFEKDYLLPAYYIEPIRYKKCSIKFRGNERVSNQI